MGRFAADPVPSLKEFLTTASNEPSFKKRAQILYKGHLCFHQFLYIALYDPDRYSELGIDVEKIRWSRQTQGMGEFEFHKVWPTIAQHLPNSSNVSPNRKLSKAYQVLESLHREDAELVLQLFTGQFQYRNITRKLYEEAYKPASPKK